jgi:hypothetical protein
MSLDSWLYGKEGIRLAAPSRSNALGNTHHQTHVHGGYVTTSQRCLDDKIGTPPLVDPGGLSGLDKQVLLQSFGFCRKARQIIEETLRARSNEIA